MPLPTPNEDEGHDEFIDRCIVDPDVQADSEDNDQALAICESLWEDNRMSEATNETERRFVPLDTGRIEVRADEDSDLRGIGGTAAVFGSETDLGMFTEEIAPGAFDDVLDGDTRGLFNHDPNYVLGRTKSGTMTLRATGDGLEYDIPSMPKSRADVMEAIERGDVDGNSFAFSVAEETWIEEDEVRDKPHRVIQRIGTLYDVGPVAFPAYGDTQVSARAEQRAKQYAEREDVAPEPVDEVEEAETEEPEPEDTAGAREAAERKLRLREIEQDLTG